MRARILVPATVAALIAVGVLAAVAFGRPAASMPMYSAKLNTAQEVPAETGAPSNAGGTFSATLSGKTLKWKLTFHNLTGPATAAHIHMGAKGKAGGVIVALCANCKSPVSGSTAVSASVIKTLNGGGAYVNVHTAKNPNGEIRGQVMG
jgi:hypothetical protein